MPLRPFLNPGLVGFLVAGLLAVVPAAFAQPEAHRPIPASTEAGTLRDEEDNEALPYYVTRDNVPLYRTSDSTRPIGTLRLRTSVYRLRQEGAWTYVRTDEGREGFVFGQPLSNTWILVSKSQRTLSLFRGATLLRTYGADFGQNPVSDKEQRGSRDNPDHWRTPDGTFYVTRLNPRSQFYRAFVLSYPTPEHAQRALARGMISARERDAIVEAHRTFAEPPMNTALGGLIEIHGRGTGTGSNWTQGCVAVRDRDMDELWGFVTVGTPVVIEP
ncbi:MAG TPA: L,D-transpeptidase family protein [Rhodothermales bacterium]|nr:L,D-transpeptidase family protein [Rhodothermales bacterium]